LSRLIKVDFCAQSTSAGIAASKAKITTIAIQRLVLAAVSCAIMRGVTIGSLRLPALTGAAVRAAMAANRHAVFLIRLPS
jgi:hypothetical protein